MGEPRCESSLPACGPVVTTDTEGVPLCQRCADEMAADPSCHAAGCRCDLCRTLDPKPYHLAKMIGPKGQVSPLCAKTPRAIDLKKALWTFRREAVTCPKCLKALKAGEEG